MKSEERITHVDSAFKSGAAHRIARNEPTRVLDKTLEYIQRKAQLRQRNIVTIYLSDYFTVIELDDGSVGACMSYYRIAPERLRSIHSTLSKMLVEEPLLLGPLFDPKHRHKPFELHHDQEYLLVKSLQATVVSALSSRFLRDGSDATFRVSTTPPFDPFAGVQRALVIGFGGYMKEIVSRKDIEEVHIADLSYSSRREDMEMTINRFRQLYPEKTISISCDGMTTPLLREFDVVSITGSALCNGTMDNVLHAARRCHRIIVQGQSASIHPKALFDKGVTFVVTTVKPNQLTALAKSDPSGNALRSVLEGRLPWIYLSRRKGGGIPSSSCEQQKATNKPERALV